MAKAVKAYLPTLGLSVLNGELKVTLSGKVSITLGSAPEVEVTEPDVKEEPKRKKVFG